jgi:hypothetical protein
MRIAPALVLMLVSVLAHGADAKYQISVNHIGEDGLGRQLAYRIKEEVRKSATLDLVPGDDDAYFSLDIRTMAPNKDPDPMWTIYSLTYTVRDPRTGNWTHWNATLSYAGKDRIIDAASDVIVWVDETTPKASVYRVAATQVKCVEFDGLTKRSRQKKDDDDTTQKL